MFTDPPKAAKIYINSSVESTFIDTSSLNSEKYATIWRSLSIFIRMLILNFCKLFKVKWLQNSVVLLFLT
ncbi:hypothetical protein AKMV-Vani-093 [Akhmeta virus]|uniref:Uncharacterized protein n=1 Tax=Orthopoxvirus akhmetapox TaxID=2200830 RepID=A0A346FSS4_9POXV|nr:hypothetical protein AKMV-Vani-093 [Akhmeta virus]